MRDAARLARETSLTKIVAGDDVTVNRHAAWRWRHRLLSALEPQRAMAFWAPRAMRCRKCVDGVEVAKAVLTRNAASRASAPRFHEHQTVANAAFRVY